MKGENIPDFPQRPLQRLQKLVAVSCGGVEEFVRPRLPLETFPLLSDGLRYVGETVLASGTLLTYNIMQLLAAHAQVVQVEHKLEAMHKKLVFAQLRIQVLHGGGLQQDDGLPSEPPSPRTGDTALAAPRCIFQSETPNYESVTCL